MIRRTFLCLARLGDRIRDDVVHALVPPALGYAGTWFGLDPLWGIAFGAGPVAIGQQLWDWYTFKGWTRDATKDIFTYQPVWIGVIASVNFGAALVFAVALGFTLWWAYKRMQKP